MTEASVITLRNITLDHGLTYKFKNKIIFFHRMKTYLKQTFFVVY